MTDLNEQSDVQDERSQIDAVDELDMANLRKVAKVLGISAQRDWSKEDFVRAIKVKQTSSETAVGLVFDNSLAPKPGYSRIILHRDMTPGHKNSPVPAGINGRIFMLPRGVEIDIPTPLVEVLANARTTIMDETGKESVTQSYPFQILAATPGKFHNQFDGRAPGYERRYAFFQKFGRWPTDGELKEAMRQRIAQVL